MRVHLVDYLGVHCGMHYYLDAFQKELLTIPNVEVKIDSNFTLDGSNPTFKHQYKGNILNKIFSLTINILRYKELVRKNPNDIFIYLTYGNKIDIPFLKITAQNSHHIIDVHEAVAQCRDSNGKIKKLLSDIYANKIKHLISHSLRTDEFLNAYGFKGKRFHVPHFRYQFTKTYDIENVGKDLREAIADDKPNVLFFGNINKEKGIDILLNSINELTKEEVSKINFIVAGKDFDGTWKSIELHNHKSVNFVLRHINDDELVYLFNHVQYLVMPYKKTSQSGVLEMAFYFKKPIIASDIPYFRQVLTEFPSFGVLVEQSLTDSIIPIINNPKAVGFFNEKDWNRYTHRQEVNLFKEDLSQWIQSIN